jgi:hypothetical protein
MDNYPAEVLVITIDHNAQLGQVIGPGPDHGVLCLTNISYPFPEIHFNTGRVFSELKDFKPT